MDELPSELPDWKAVAEEQRADRRPLEWSAPVVLPPHWALDVVDVLGGARYKSYSRSLVAILTCSYEQDGRAWLHLSLSHRARLPLWQEVREAKEVFLGEREAYQVLPPPSRYVNLRPNVLHLFALLDKDKVALPDFTRGTRSL